jgi:hypothetical protein
MLRVNPVFVSVTVTVAPGIEAPVWSATVPRMVPVNVCAKHNDVVRAIASRTKIVQPHFRIEKRLHLVCAIQWAGAA